MSEFELDFSFAKEGAARKSSSFEPLPAHHRTAQPVRAWNRARGEVLCWIAIAQSRPS